MFKIIDTLDLTVYRQMLRDCVAYDRCGGVIVDAKAKRVFHPEDRGRKKYLYEDFVAAMHDLVAAQHVLRLDDTERNFWSIGEKAYLDEMKRIASGARGRVWYFALVRSFLIEQDTWGQRLNGLAFELPADAVAAKLLVPIGGTPRDTDGKYYRYGPG